MLNLSLGIVFLFESEPEEIGPPHGEQEQSAKEDRGLIHLLVSHGTHMFRL